MRAIPARLIATATFLLGQLGWSKTPLIYDNSGSIDEFTVTAMVALSKRVNLRLVTIVPADSYKDQALRSEQAVLSLIGRKNIEVSSSDHEGINLFPDVWRRDASRFLQLKHLQAHLPHELPKTSAVHRLIDVLSGPGKFEILATGPLSNIAEVLRKRPDLSKKIKRIYIMGGAIHVGGNVLIDTHDHSAEWNFYNDPQSAKSVLSSGIAITLVPLDVTDKMPVTHAFLQSLRGQSSRLWSQHLLQSYELLMSQIEPSSTGPQAYCFWGPTTAAAVLAPELIKTKPMRIRIESEGKSMGRTVEDAKGHLVSVAIGVNKIGFEKWMLDLFRGGPLVNDADSPSYVERMQVQYERTDEKQLVTQALRELLGQRHFGRSLDIGPGPGDVSAPLAERSDQLTMVELKSEYRETLSKKFPKAEVVIDSIYNREYHNELDAILYSHGLYYVPEDQWLSTIQKFMSYLKPGGSLFVVMNSDTGDMWSLAQHFWRARPDTKTHSWRNWTEFKKDLAPLGALHTRSVTYHWRFPKAEAVAVIGSSLLAITDPVVLAREAAEIEKYSQRFIHEGNQMVINTSLEIVEIQKPGQL